MRKLLWFVAAAGLSAYLFWPRAAARISLSESACYLPDARFMLQWRHSVERQLWREYYRSDGRLLHLERAEMQTFGAGVPADGENMPAANGFVGQKSRVSLPEINWAVSKNMQGEIHTLQHAWPVYAQVPDYSTIRIAPAFVPQAAVWLGACDE